MPPRIRVSAAVALMVVSCAAVAVWGSVENLNYERVRVVDFCPETGHWLFRGNQPQRSATEFAYDELHAYMQQRAVESGWGAFFPASAADYELVDVSFLTPNATGAGDEGAALALERAWFAAHPTTGWLQWTPLYGDATDPWHYDEPERFDLSRALPLWQADALVARVAAVRELLVSPRRHNGSGSGSGKRLVIYFHCGHGQDRTGEFATLYYLQYLGWSWARVWAWNNGTIGQDVAANVRSSMWACQYAQNALALPQPVDCTNVL